MPVFNYQELETKTTHQTKSFGVQQNGVKKLDTVFSFLSIFGVNLNNEVANDLSSQLESPHTYTQKHGFGGNLICTVCNAETVLSADGKTGLESSEFLAAVCDNVFQHISLCADCTTNQVQSYCSDCNLFLCLQCNQRLHSGSQTKFHHVAQACGGQGDDTLTLLAEKFKICKDHPGEKAMLFCEQCEQMVCFMCIYSKHDKHKKILLTEAAGVQKQKLINSADLIAQKSDSIRLTRDSIQNGLSLIDQNSFNSRQTIQKTISSAVNELKILEKELLDEINDQAHNKKLLLQKQQNDLQSRQADLELRHQTIKKLTKSNNDYLITQFSEPVTSTMNQLLQSLPSLALQSDSSVDCDTKQIASLLRVIANEIDPQVKQEPQSHAVDPRLLVNNNIQYCDNVPASNPQPKVADIRHQYEQYATPPTYIESQVRQNQSISADLIASNPNITVSKSYVVKESAKPPSVIEKTQNEPAKDVSAKAAPKRKYKRRKAEEVPQEQLSGNATNMQPATVKEKEKVKRSVPVVESPPIRVVKLSSSDDEFDLPVISWSK
ncbi:hypothetical protein MIR68_010813 [Amoeboaphelidium protococcarum]|nr:hypothetical protein MIR68_010813 [Amoeboaphelidium protococcarum]